ncbi:MAG TPA: sugar ABC transporter permease [Jiangellales bacterium]|nr:sugar ABC transporter permease [Jiangellales bacterium]
MANVLTSTPAEQVAPDRPQPRLDPRSRHRRRLFVPFVAPALVVYTVLFVAPAVVSVWISLYSWHGSGDPMHFVGLRNYVHLANDPLFLHSFLNSLAILFVTGAITFAISLAFTIPLRHMWGRKIIRAILFFPQIVSPVVLGIAWGFILDPTTGALNTVLRHTGLGGLAQPWLGPDLIFKVILLISAWSSVGFYTTVLMAGVDKIPAHFYEEAELAGASAWQKFRYVTLPLNWDVLAMSGVLWVITSMKTFEFIYAFAGIGQLPSANTWTSALYVYAIGFSSSGLPQYGLASAMSVVMLLVIAILVVLLRRLSRREALEF